MAQATTKQVEIEGSVAPAFGRVKDAFRENVHERGEIGASLCVRIDGEVVVDLWAGTADLSTGRPWTGDTPAVVFSVTKGFVALAFLMLEDRGLIDLDAPVTRWWPEFGQAGKEGITVRTLLNHRTGLCAVDHPIRIEEFATPTLLNHALARQAPLWTPGEAQGYGATAWGMYAGPLFRRMADRTVGRFLADEVFGPLGVDAWLGLPADVLPRVARIYPTPTRELLRRVLPELPRAESMDGRVYRAFFERGSETSRALRNPDMGRRRLDAFNDPAVLAMELPWANLVTTARSVAAVYAALAGDGTLGDVELVRPAAVRKLVRRQSWSWSDRVLHKPMGFAQGFIKEEPHLFSPNEAAFGHPGVGGSLGMADPTHKLAVGYVMNRLDHRIRSPRALALCHAIYRSLGYG